MRRSSSSFSSSATAASARSISVSTSPMPRMRDAMRSGWNHSSASSFSPTRRELDRLAGDGLHRERRAAARVAVELRQDDAVEVDPLLERLRDVDGLLAGHRVEHEQDVRRLRLAPDRGELLHQRLVDVEAAGGVEDHDVAAVGLRALDPVAHGLAPGRCARRRRRGRRPARRAGSSWSIAAGRWRSAATSAGFRPSFCEQQRELAGGGRLARALQAGEEDRRRRPRRERELRGARAHQLGQLLVDDLHDLLARA